MPISSEFILEIKAKKSIRMETEQVELLAKNVINNGNNFNEDILIRWLYDAMNMSNTFAILIKGCADLYVKAEHRIDIRMTAGSQMLKDIASNNLYDEIEPKYLFLIKPMVKDMPKENEEIKNFIGYASKNQESMCIAQNALLTAIISTHPTIVQSFLRCVRSAALSVKDNVAYSVIGNSYLGALPNF